MRRPTHIAPDLTVRQVAAAWPSCAERLGQYSGARAAGGRWTLQELAPFARDHGVEPRRLLAELAAAAAVPVADSGGASARGASPVPLVFTAAAVCLTLGAGWGASLLLRIAWGADYAAVPGAGVHVHGVAQLWGWVALFVFAVATHLLRQNTRRPAPPWLERAAGALVVAGLLAFLGGLFEPLRRALPRVNVAASACLLGAAVLFAVSVLWSLGGRAKAQRPTGVLACVGWLLAWAGTDLALRLRYADAAVLPDSARDLLIILAVLGFATSAVYGFGIRLIPGLLNVGRLRPRLFAAALAAHNAGLCLLLLSLLSPLPQSSPRAFGAVGAGLMLEASVLYLAGMDWLRSKPSRPIYGVDVRGHALVRVAYFWLVCGLAMVFIGQLVPGLPHAYAGAWRHALTVGFVTTMILGVGQRIVPIFIKQPLASTRLMLASAALIVTGNALRVGLELATIGGRPAAFRLMGATGLLEWSALALFALNLALTVRNRRHVYAAGEPLTADTRVREAINARPVLQERLDGAGITMFDDAPFVAPSMTFGALALACGFEPSDLLSRLSVGGDESPAARREPGGGPARVMAPPG